MSSQVSHRRGRPINCCQRRNCGKVNKLVIPITISNNGDRILHRFWDMTNYRQNHGCYLPRLSSPRNLIMLAYPSDFRTMLGSPNRKRDTYWTVKLLSDYLNVCDQNPPTLQTDRQTDGQTTCDNNTALRTCMLRAKKL